MVICTDQKKIVGAFKSPQGQQHDPIALNHLLEVAQFTNDARYIEGKANAVGDWLSRPPGTPLGTAYQLPQPEIYSISNPLTIEIIRHKHMEKDQTTCPDKNNFKAGKLPPNTEMAYMEFSHKVEL